MSKCQTRKMNAEKGDNQEPSGPVGTIKKTLGKVTSEGLIELPPEPGAVKFECQGISRPSSSTAVRVGSAGRVERSLQLARKKELADEIPTRCNSAGAEMISLAKVKHSKQIQEMENSLRQAAKVSNNEDNTDSDSSSSSSSEEIQEEKERTANQIQNNEPLDELKAEFLTTVMDENYEKAKELCQKILLLEPDNKLCSEFHAVIVEKIKQDVVSTEDSEDEDESDEEDGNDEKSGDSDDDGEESNDSDDDDDDDDDDDGDDDDGDDEESDSGDDYSTPSGPINLIMGGLPIKPHNR